MGRPPHDPSVERLYADAQRLLDALHARDPQALELISGLAPPIAAPARTTATEARRAIAWLYGLPSWPAALGWVERASGRARAAPVRGRRRDGAGGRGARATAASPTATTRRSGATGREAILAANPGLASSSIHVAAAVGDVEAARSLLAVDPGLAHRQGGPVHLGAAALPRLLRASRPTSRVGARSRSRSSCSRPGPTPPWAFLWEGLVPPFTALTGAFGRGEGWDEQPPHPDCEALARLLLEAGADANDGQTLYNRHFAPDDAHLELLLAHGLGRGDGGVWHRRLAPIQATPAIMLEDELLFAAANGYAARVALLLRHGVDPLGLGSRTSDPRWPRRGGAGSRSRPHRRFRDLPRPIAPSLPEIGQTS